LAVTNSVLQGFLGRHRKIGLDTKVCIFQVEGNPNDLGLVTPNFCLA
jgi:hypothetical protein